MSAGLVCTVLACTFVAAGWFAPTRHNADHVCIMIAGVALVASGWLSGGYVVGALGGFTIANSLNGMWFRSFVRDMRKIRDADAALIATLTSALKGSIARRKELEACCED